MQSQTLTTLTTTRKRHRTQAWCRLVRSTLALRAESQEAMAECIGIHSSQVRQAVSQGVHPGTIRAIESFLGIVPKSHHIAKGAPTTSSTAANRRRP